MWHIEKSKTDEADEVEADEVLEKPFDLLKNRYQNNLKLMKDSEVVFYHVHLLYFKSHKTNLNLGGSYIDSPGWIKKQKRNNKSYY